MALQKAKSAPACGAGGDAPVFRRVTTTFMGDDEVQELAKAKADEESGHGVHERGDLPTLSDTCSYELFYVEEHIMNTVGNLLNLTHGGLVLKKEKHGGATDSGPAAMTIQYFGVSFGPDVLVPRLVDAPHGGVNLQWRNDSLVVFSPRELPPYKGVPRWDGGRLQHVGNVSGVVLNRWFEWVASYSARQPGYQMWDVWDGTDILTSQRWLQGSKCDDFVEASLVELHRLGASLVTTDVLCKNCVPFISKARPQRVDMTNMKEAARVASFYEMLGSLGRGLGGGGGALTLPILLRTIATTLDTWYVFDRAATVYYRVQLVPPYMQMDRLYQPMLLPWQAEHWERERAAMDPLQAGEQPDAYGAAQLLLGVATRGLQLVGSRVLFSTQHRRLLRFLSILGGAVSVSVLFWLRRVFPSEPELLWCYLGGILNGAILLPLLIALVVGERSFSATKQADYKQE
jgi:hypothetical protein